MNNNCPAVLKSWAFFVIIKALFIKRGRSLKDFTEKLTRPALLKASYEELEMLSCEIRSFLIEKISKCGGHLASNLGAVELTIAMHRVFDPNVDRIVFDVGHQTYTHKLLSGRAEGLKTSKAGRSFRISQTLRERNRCFHSRACIQFSLRGAGHGQGKKPLR